MLLDFKSLAVIDLFEELPVERLLLAHMSTVIISIPIGAMDCAGKTMQEIQQEEARRADAMAARAREEQAAAAAASAALAATAASGAPLAVHSPGMLFKT